ncbi:MAG: alpha/beta fold hydrolase [Kofleriaceae bacterium]
MHGYEVIEGEVWEDVVKLGREGALLGIVTHPAREDRERPIVMFLNAGVLHRVGPHRLHVALARRLAQRGLRSIRLDLGGLGDSPATATSGSFVEGAVADVRAAMTDLERQFQTKRFVIFGLCSGADNGLAAAAEDDRVVGLVLLDPPSYATRRATLRKAARRVRELGSAREVARWGMNLAVRQVRRRVAALRARLGPTPPAEAPAPGREAPPQESLRRTLQALVDRGVAVLAVYSGAYGDRYNHRDQIFELFPELRGRVDHEYYPAANHMFTEVAAQRALMALVVSWLTKRFA